MPNIGLPIRVKLFLAALMLLLLGELSVGFPCQAQSQASSSASTQAGLQAPANIGRRRRGGRGRRALYRRQVYQANRLAAQQQTQRDRELARRQHQGDQTQLKREQALARTDKSEFIKEYGTSKRRILQNKRKSNLHPTAPAVHSALPSSVESKK